VVGDRLKYVKRENQSVVAVQLALDTEGFTYQKWGDVQTCKPGDWIVDNDGDIYTVDQQTFARTYRKVDGGKYVKVTPVWAERALNAGHVKTKEGTTHYRRGDYIVFNDEEGHDGYAVDAEKFCAMYQPAD
jgi:translation elongation factor P/translation initiation factor 5A